MMRRYNFFEYILFTKNFFDNIVGVNTINHLLFIFRPVTDFKFSYQNINAYEHMMNPY